MNMVIIKLGALGDVVRTTPLLLGLKEKYPDSEITWITKSDSKEILEGNPHIKDILTIPLEGSIGSFDILYNFDIEDEATSLAQSIEANKKLGFYSQDGFPMAFNLGAEYYLNTLFDDELKKSNTKTYQQMMFEAAELEYKQQPCLIYLNDKDKRYAEDFVNSNSIDTTHLIGLNIGSSSRWPSKAWSQDRIIEFIFQANQKGYNLLVLGGPNEKEQISNLVSTVKSLGVNVYQNDPDNLFKEFASLINICSKIVCADTMALHVALALKIPTIGLFFCTSPNEVEGYSLLTKIVSPMLNDYFPEKSDQYSEELVNSISVEEVLEALEHN
jgi:heptosyltransferase-2